MIRRNKDACEIRKCQDEQNKANQQDQWRNCCSEEKHEEKWWRQKHDEHYHEGDSPLLNMKMTFSRSQTTPED